MFTETLHEGRRWWVVHESQGSLQVIVVHGSVENTVLTQLKSGSDSLVRTTSATPMTS